MVSETKGAFTALTQKVFLTIPICGTQRAATLENAARDVQAMTPAAEVTYAPISSADAVILYARNFLPSWAGAIAIDLLPAVLVLILAVTQSAIRSGREGAAIEDMLTLAELRAAVIALRDVEEVAEGTGALPAAATPEAPKPDAQVTPLRGDTK